MKEEYGEDYFVAYKKNIESQTKGPHPNLQMLVDAMVEATAAEFPRERYLIGGTTGVYDLFTFDFYKVKIDDNF